MTGRGRGHAAVWRTAVAAALAWLALPSAAGAEAPGAVLPIVCHAPENTTDFEARLDLVADGDGWRPAAVSIAALGHGAERWEDPVRRGGSTLTPTAHYGEGPFVAFEYASTDGPVAIRLARFPGADGPFFAGALSIGDGRWTVDCYPAVPVVEPEAAR